MMEFWGNLLGKVGKILSIQDEVDKYMVDVDAGDDQVKGHDRGLGRLGRHSLVTIIGRSQEEFLSGPLRNYWAIA